MAKKKNTRKTGFSEIMGISNIFQNDIFNFIFGILILLLSVFLVIAFISYIISGQNDQSLNPVNGATAKGFSITVAVRSVPLPHISSCQGALDLPHLSFLCLWLCSDLKW